MLLNMHVACAVFDRTLVDDELLLLLLLMFLFKFEDWWGAVVWVTVRDLFDVDAFTLFDFERLPTMG